MRAQQKPDCARSRSALMAPAVGQGGNKAKPATRLALEINAHRCGASVGAVIEHGNENTAHVSPDDHLERSPGAARGMRQRVRDKLASEQHGRIRKRASVQNGRDEPPRPRHSRGVTIEIRATSALSGLASTDRPASSP